MRDQKKAEEIALQRVQLLSPLLVEGLDSAQARQIKASYANRQAYPSEPCVDTYHSTEQKGLVG